MQHQSHKCAMQLAVMYSRGDGVAKNVRKAAECEAKARCVVPSSYVTLD